MLHRPRHPEDWVPTEDDGHGYVVLPGLTDDFQLARTCEALHDRFGIEHATLQLEHGSKEHPCQLAPEDVV